MRCPPLPPEGGEVWTLFGAVLLRADCTVYFKLFIRFERIRASTLGDVEQIKIIMFGAVRLRAARTAFHELFVHSERTRAATQGVICLICVIYCVISCQLKYIGTVEEANFGHISQKNAN